MSGTLVNYPVEITTYKVAIDKDKAIVLLAGVEENTLNAETKPVGRMTFTQSPSSNPDFYNRGGSLEMARPLFTLSAILDILRNEKPVYLDYKGHPHSARLRTSQEPVGEIEFD